MAEHDLKPVDAIDSNEKSRDELNEIQGDASIQEQDLVKEELPQVDWTEEEEAKAKRKLDMLIMPLLSLGYFCLQLDRGNISSAITDTLLQDVGISQLQFNVGQQLLSLGIVLFEIPSNMALYKLGPGKWLSLQLFLFGLVSTFQAFQTNRAGFLVTRFLLGVTESGYIPGGLWTVSTWYTRSETAKRVMVFFFGSMLSQAVTKLLAYAILHMRGVAGYPGWFWLFVLMGAFTILSGCVLACCLPDSYENPRSWFLPKHAFFSERELHILRNRIQIDDPNKRRTRHHIGISSFKKTFSNWLIWVHFFITLGNNGPFRGFDTYGPIVIEGFGFPELKSNALASVGLFLQIPVAYVFSYVSDRYNRRGETVILAVGMHLLGYVFNRIFAQLDNRGARYFGVVWTATFGNMPHPLNIAWMSTICRDSEERSLAMALVSASANIGAIYGAQIFQADDAPRYRTAFTICIGVLAATLFLAISRYLYERVARKRQGLVGSG